MLQVEWKSIVHRAFTAPGVALALVSAGCDGPSAYQDLSGERIYSRLCTQCHGEQGRALHGRGGSYLGKRKYWTRETLLEYLDDPQGPTSARPPTSRPRGTCRRSIDTCPQRRACGSPTTSSA